MIPIVQLSPQRAICDHLTGLGDVLSRGRVVERSHRSLIPLVELHMVHRKILSLWRLRQTLCNPAIPKKYRIKLARSEAHG